MAASDWDKAGFWAIDEAQYISSPSSLSETAVDAYLLCKKAGLTDLPQGRITTSFRSNNPAAANASLILMFRNQLAVGGADRQNTYTLTWYGTTCQINRYVSGSNTFTASFGGVAALSANTWYKFRLTWWTDWTQLRFRLEQWNTGEGIWELNNDGDVFDPSPLWDATGISRVGIWLKMYSPNYTWYEDTEIWKAVT